MAQKELKRMNRSELIEIIYAIQQREKALNVRNADLEQKLESKIIKIQKAGSIAQAALEINKVMEAAQAAADQYVQSVCSQEYLSSLSGQDMIESARKQGEEIIRQARRQGEVIVSQARRQSEEILRQAYQKSSSSKIESPKRESFTSNIPPYQAQTVEREKLRETASNIPPYQVQTVERERLRETASNIPPYQVQTVEKKKPQEVVCNAGQSQDRGEDSDILAYWKMMDKLNQRDRNSSSSVRRETREASQPVKSEVTQEEQLKRERWKQRLLSGEYGKLILDD